MAALVWLCWWGPALIFRSPNIITASLGEPAPRSLKAPRQITFVSDVKTQQARLAAARSIEDVYTGRDRDIAREQIRLLYDLIEEITAIREDPTLGQASRSSRLAAIDALPKSDKLRLSILLLTDDEWQGVMDEALRVLDLVMRDEVRPALLDEALSNAERLTTHTLTDSQYDVVVALVQAMVTSNSHYDQQETLAARRKAQNEVAPVHHTVMAGQSILREGELVDALAIETLDALGLLRKGVEWEDVVGYGVIYALIIIAVSMLVVRSNPLLLLRPRRELLYALILITVGVASRLAVPGRTLMPYLLPTAAAAMVVALLIDLDLAIAVAMVSAFLVAFDGGSVAMGAYALIGGLIGALTMWRMDQLGSFVRVTLYLVMTNVAVLLAFSLVSHNYDIVGLLQLTGAGIINAVLSTSLTFVAFSFIGRAFGIATSLQLLELARPTHPLFRQLLVEAPGTYHHSIVISNMAERAAEAIGADALLARVGAYYHDIGKTLRPGFFSENQSDGVNPHHQLDPKSSANIIVSHTVDGLALARKHHIPERVCAFIAEHHGTTPVTYFYRQALQDADDDIIDEAEFSYPGPIPQSKETAIVMLADSIEAWVRANSPPTQAEMERVIRRVINDRLISGQLDACDLTLSDLDAIRLAFTSVLKGIFHPRIKYPERVTRAARRNGGNNHGG